MTLDRPHRRWNPLRQEWILVSPHRAARPWLGAAEKAPPPNRPKYDSGCYLCPGNTRANGMQNPNYTELFVFENDFAALLPPDQSALELPSAPFIKAEAADGICRVVCFSPRHDLTLTDLSATAIESVINCWTQQYSELSRRPDIAHTMIFENKGAIMGCSNPHPHGQIWATSYIPDIPLRSARAQADYVQAHGRDLLGDYLDWELRAAERIVCANSEWVAVVPFWAMWPFEVTLLPRRGARHSGELHPEQVAAWSELLQQLLIRYDNLFDCSFPYSMGLYQAPSDGQSWLGFRLHQVFFPPLLRSASVKKFIAGFELCAEPQRDLLPEQAAARLREVSAVGRKLS